jgi:hypothetical protein
MEAISYPIHLTTERRFLFQLLHKYLKKIYF